MLKSLSLAAILTYGYSPKSHAAANPASPLTKAYPEVHPGPGLPSLASLGLASADLYQSTPALLTKPSIPSSHPKQPTVPPSLGSKPAERHTAFTNACQGGEDATAAVDDVIACFNYLQSIGNYDCTVLAGDQPQMCRAGTASVEGASVTGETTTAACTDVAAGVQWVFTYCNNDGQVEGSAAAYGNGNLVVVVGAAAGKLKHGVSRV
ncbi:hypothetical protein MMC13_003734 [Lambiella insularis]|nr:hypothetical protein [Lambiella insularis]